ncbi:MAG: phosphotransferase [Candidatus Dormibacteraeota bacterium]|nr:phosphotransferase [Candidatus Dormibacteraeota bacterium]
MIPALPAAELEPLCNPALAARLPTLAAAMDAATMAQHLQRALFSGSPSRVIACGRPRAVLDGDSCALQYPVTLLGSDGAALQLPVLAEVFATAEAARDMHDTLLGPLSEEWGRIDIAQLTWSAALGELRMACSVFPVSAALPQLVRVLAPGYLDALLQSSLRDTEIRVESDELVVLRRTRGCVLRVRIEGREPRTAYAKVGYAAYGGAAADALAQLRSGPVTPALRLPEVLGRDDALDVTVLAELPGTRPDLRTDAEQMVGAAARCAALLHASRVEGAPHRTLHDEVARASDAVDRVAPYAPAVSSWLRDVLHDAESAAGGGEEAPVFCHGDLAPSQVLLHEGVPAILDFDKCCSAEPALDLGRYLAYLRFALAKAGDPRSDPLAKGFLRTYETAGGTVPPAARLSAYETVALVRMAARSWLQLKPQRLRLACDVIARRL